jgi:hypothetical protein
VFWYRTPQPLHRRASAFPITRCLGAAAARRGGLLVESFTRSSALDVFLVLSSQLGLLALFYPNELLASSNEQPDANCLHRSLIFCSLETAKFDLPFPGPLFETIRYDLGTRPAGCCSPLVFHDFSLLSQLSPPLRW